MKIKWILIGDGSRAKILEKSHRELKNIGLTHHISEVSSHKDKGHHQPGVVSPSVVHAKHSFPSHEEWGEFEKHEFAKVLGELLNKEADAFDELMLIAPGKITSEIRAHLNKKSLEKITEEIHKDYTHTPIKEIEEML